MVNEYPGGYDDWLSQRKSSAPQVKKRDGSIFVKKIKTKIAPSPFFRKLTYKEQRELESLPEKIEKLELEQKEIYALLTDISFYLKDPKEIAKAKARLAVLEIELEEANGRWEYLENLSGDL